VLGFFLFLVRTLPSHVKQQTKRHCHGKSATVAEQCRGGVAPASLTRQRVTTPTRQEDLSAACPALRVLTTPLFFFAGTGARR